MWGGSPAAGAPFLQMRTLAAEVRVVTVPGVEPGLVRQPVEHLGLEVVHQRGEARPVGGPSWSSRKQGVAGEQVWGALRIVIEQRNRSGGVPDEVDHLEAAVTDLDDVSVVPPPATPLPPPPRRSTRTGSSSASAVPATVSAPVAATTSGSARWWSQCWWVVITRLSPSPPTTWRMCGASSAASMRTCSSVRWQRSR